MSTQMFFSYAGVFFIGVLLLCALFFLSHMLIDSLAESRERSQLAAKRIARQELVLDMVNNVHWFSEYPLIMKYIYSVYDTNKAHNAHLYDAEKVRYSLREMIKAEENLTSGPKILVEDK